MGWLKRVIDHDIFYSFTRSWVIMRAAFVTLFIIITSVFAPWVTIHDPLNPSSLNLMDAFTPIDTLPVPRTINGAVLLAPGTSDTGPGGNVTFSGAFAYEGLFLINGVVANETLRNQVSNVFIEDAIQETKVMTASSRLSTAASPGESPIPSPSQVATTTAGRSA